MDDDDEEDRVNYVKHKCLHTYGKLRAEDDEKGIINQRIWVSPKHEEIKSAPVYWRTLTPDKLIDGCFPIDKSTVDDLLERGVGAAVFFIEEENLEYHYYLDDIISTGMKRRNKYLIHKSRGYPIKRYVYLK